MNSKTHYEWRIMRANGIKEHFISGASLEQSTGKSLAVLL